MSRNRCAVFAMVFAILIAVAAACDLVPVETLTKIFEDEFENFWPSLSHDGKYLVFCSDKDDNDYPYFEYDIWCLELETGELRQLTVNNTEEYWSIDRRPCWSPDGQWIYFIREYTDYEEDVYQLCRVPFSGGEDNVEVLSNYFKNVDIDSTGTKLVGHYYEHQVAKNISVYDIPSGVITPVPATNDFFAAAVKVLPDDSGVMASTRIDYDTGFSSDVVIFPFDGGSDPEGFHFEHSETVDRISFSPDGDYCFFQSGNEILKVSWENGETQNLVPDMDTLQGACFSDGFVYFCTVTEPYKRYNALWRLKP